MPTELGQTEQQTLSQNLIIIADLIKEANGLSEKIKTKIVGDARECSSMDSYPEMQTMMGASIIGVEDLRRLIRTLDSINCSL